MTDYSELFTEDVVARWWRLFQRGKSLNWIAKNNGLHKTSGNTVKQYFVRYGYLSGDEDLRQYVQAATGADAAPASVAVRAATARVPLSKLPAPVARPDPVMRVAGEASDLEEQLLAIQQIMSTVRAQDVAISGTITLQLNVEIAV